MKFHVHVFEDRRHKFLVEAESIQDAYEKVSNCPDLGTLNEVEVENTGEFGSAILVDALLPDSTTDYYQTQWFGLEAP